MINRGVYTRGGARHGPPIAYFGEHRDAVYSSDVSGWYVQLRLKPPVNDDALLPGSQLVEEAMRRTLVAATPIPPTDEKQQQQEQHYIRT